MVLHGWKCTHICKCALLYYSTLGLEFYLFLFNIFLSKAVLSLASNYIHIYSLIFFLSHWSVTDMIESFKNVLCSFKKYHMSLHIRVHIESLTQALRLYIFEIRLYPLWTFKLLCVLLNIVFVSLNNRHTLY